MSQILNPENSLAGEAFVGAPFTLKGTRAAKNIRQQPVSYKVGKPSGLNLSMGAHNVIPEEIMLARLTQSDDMREFFIEMWKQNPALAKQGGARVQSLLTPLTDDAGHGLQNREVGDMIKQRGTSLIELIMFIVIVSVALVGILLVMNTVTKGSADPIIHKQALAIAESLLEEVELMPFTFCDPDDVNAASAVIDTGCAGTNQDNGGGALTTIPVGETRGSATPFDNVADYAGFTINPATDIAGNTYPGYSATVTITRAGAALMGVPDGAALRITVTVDGPGGVQIVLDGYRTRSSPRT